MFVPSLMDRFVEHVLGQLKFLEDRLLLDAKNK